MSQPIGPGSVIAGRYQVEAKAGHGGMAVVYRAEDLQLGRKVAVKVLHAQYAEDQDFVERFKREAKAAAQLQHPGIVAIYDSGEWEGTWYIAMELLEGPTLKERLNAEGRFSPAESVELIEKILRAVRAAHRDGIIHRDLKPHNVILDDQGEPKVTDFGIARRGASDMTATGSILGTAHYLAPEQAQGEVITPRTDLYAVGVMLYEMLTGRTPFEGDSAVSIALAHVNNEPRSPRSIVPEISPALDAVVMRALAKRPSDRFADADAFLAALADAKRGIAPVYAPPTGEHAPAPALAPHQPQRVVVGPVPTPWWKRPWAFALLGLLVIAAVVAALLLGSETRVRVPDVTGSTVTIATERLERAGFEVTVVERQSRRPAGIVISQQPGGGEQAPEGATVRLVVSQGAGSAPVPQVEGQTREEAVDRIESAGFKTKVIRRSSDDVDNGRVIETNPSGGSLASLDTTVQIVVSSGRKRVTLPDLTGQPVEAARSTLSELGLTATVVEEPSEDREPGIVLSSDPAAGTKVRAGDEITLTVSAEPEGATVPDVVGQRQSPASRTLRERGFTVAVTREPVTDPLLNDEVLSTDPAGGTETDRGATVTIVIGEYTEPAEPPATETSP